MKQINTQKEFDKLKEVKSNEEIEVNCEVRLNRILNVYGKIIFRKKTDCSFTENRYISALENSSVEARDNSSVEALGNSSVEALGNSSVVAWGNSSVVARDNSSVEALGNSSVVAWGNSSVVACENSSVVAYGNSSVKAYGNSLIRLFSDSCKISMNGFSVLFKDSNLKIKIKKTKNCIIQNVKLLPFLEREGVEVKNKKVILYKKVSNDFKTQENTENETLWKVGTTLMHPKWNPKETECGEGKFHACSRAYFCDEFRNNTGDRYIAIEIKVKDLFEWNKNPDYPHKIAFREGKVLYECDRKGNKLDITPKTGGLND